MAASMAQHGAHGPVQVILPQGLSFDREPQGWNVRYLPPAKKRPIANLTRHKKFGKR